MTFFSSLRPAGRLIDDIKLVQTVEREELVACLGPNGQTGAVLVKVDEVDVQVLLLHHFFNFQSQIENIRITEIFVWNQCRLLSWWINSRDFAVRINNPLISRNAPDRPMFSVIKTEPTVQTQGVSLHVKIIAILRKYVKLSQCY